MVLHTGFAGRRLRFYTWADHDPNDTTHNSISNPQRFTRPIRHIYIDPSNRYQFPYHHTYPSPDLHPDYYPVSNLDCGRLQHTHGVGPCRPVRDGPQ